MSPYVLTEEQARAVFEVLKRECGHVRNDWTTFLPYMREESLFPKEYRFCGELGWGGKIYIERDAWKVKYYPEDQTEERDGMVKRANEALRQLFKRK